MKAQYCFKEQKNHARIKKSVCIQKVGDMLPSLVPQTWIEAFNPPVNFCCSKHSTLAFHNQGEKRRGERVSCLRPFCVVKKPLVIIDDNGHLDCGNAEMDPSDPFFPEAHQLLYVNQEVPVHMVKSFFDS